MIVDIMIVKVGRQVPNRLQFLKLFFLQKNEEIESLKDRLNQSFVTISELQKEIKSLKKENRQVNQDTSSLLLTARVELGRKQRNIASLQQKYDPIG